jgi:hypothetical protein
MGIDPCQMMDGPVRIGAVLTAFAAFIVLLIVAGTLVAAQIPNTRGSGRLLFAAIVFFSMHSSCAVYRWGMVTDVTVCEPLSDAVTVSILIGLNLMLAVAWLTSKWLRMMSKPPSNRVRPRPLP